MNFWFWNSTYFNSAACYGAARAHANADGHFIIFGCATYMCLRSFVCPCWVCSLTQTFCQQSLLKISLSSSQCMQFTNIPPQVFAPCPLGKSWDKSIMIRLSSELFTCFSPTKSLSTCRAELMLMLMFRGLSFRDYIISVRKVSWNCHCSSL